MRRRAPYNRPESHTRLTPSRAVRLYTSVEQEWRTGLSLGVMCQIPERVELGFPTFAIGSACIFPAIGDWIHTVRMQRIECLKDTPSVFHGFDFFLRATMQRMSDEYRSTEFATYIMSSRVVGDMKIATSSRPVLRKKVNSL